MQIAQRTFVVTGAAHGIGQQVVMNLASRGAHIAAVDRDAESLGKTAELARHLGARTSTHTVDVTDRIAVERLPGEVLQSHQHVDGLVNVAGVIHRFAPFTDLEADDAQRIMDVNFFGTVNTCRTFLPHLLGRPEANVTNMSSLSALLPFASQSLYSASKGAVKQFSEGLYAELRDSNTHVVTVFPGNIATDLTVHSGVRMLDAGGRKVRNTSASAAGKKIVDGIAKNRFRVIVGADAVALHMLSRISPKQTTGFVAKRIMSALQDQQGQTATQ